jgi:hypothetical protein
MVSPPEEELALDGWIPEVKPHRRDLLETNPSGVAGLLAAALLVLCGAVAWRFGYLSHHMEPVQAALRRKGLIRLANLFDAKTFDAKASEATTPDALVAAVGAGHNHIQAVTTQIEDARQDLLKLDDAALRSVLGEELYHVCQRLDAIVQAPPPNAAGWAQVHHMLHGQTADIQRIRRIAGSIRVPAVADVTAARLAEIPQDRESAYAALGLNGDASESAAKKVVDGLRQTWHPDAARDDGDRAVRESRMKQINAAWDLIRLRTETAA